MIVIKNIHVKLKCFCCMQYNIDSELQQCNFFFLKSYEFVYKGKRFKDMEHNNFSTVKTNGLKPMHTHDRKVTMEVLGKYLHNTH